MSLDSTAIALRTEEEIIGTWKYYPKDIKVSISCTTYNHRPYIEDCLRGFLIQETDFPIEILVHDDASTDGTAEVIRDYEQRYPRLFKPIYQTVNQYSQHRHIGTRFNFPRALGDYVASCEGDDFWTDPHKLQIQYDFLIANPDFSMCFHDCRHVRDDGSVIRNTPERKNVDKVYTREDLISLPGGIATATKMRANLYKRGLALDDFLDLAGDFPSNALWGQFGTCKHISTILPSVRRVHMGGAHSGLERTAKIFTTVSVQGKVLRYFLERKRYSDANISLKSNLRAQMTAAERLKFSGKPPTKNLIVKTIGRVRTIIYKVAKKIVLKYLGS